MELYDKERILKNHILEDVRSIIPQGAVYYVSPNISTISNLKLSQKRRPMLVISEQAINSRIYDSRTNDEIVLACEITSDYITDNRIPFVNNGRVSFIDPWSTIRIPATELNSIKPFCFCPKPLLEMTKYVYYKIVSGIEDDEIEQAIVDIQYKTFELIEEGVLDLYRDMDNSESLRDVYLGGKFSENVIYTYIRNPSLNGALSYIRTNINEQEIIKVTTEAQREAIKERIETGHTELDSSDNTVYKTKTEGFNSVGDAILRAMGTLDISDINETDNTSNEDLSEKEVACTTENENTNDIKKCSTKPIKRREKSRLKPYQEIGKNEKIKLRRKSSLNSNDKYAFIVDYMKIASPKKIAKINNSTSQTVRTWAKEFSKELKDLNYDLPNDGDVYIRPIAVSE